MGTRCRRCNGLDISIGVVDLSIESSLNSLLVWCPLHGLYRLTCVLGRGKGTLGW